MRRSVMIGLLLLFFGAATTGSNELERAVLALPPDFRATMDHYASVDRPDGKTYRLYVSGLPLETWRRGQEFPEGTIFVIESFRAAVDDVGRPLRDENGHLIAGDSENDVHVMMKSEAWGDDGVLSSQGRLRGSPTAGGVWRMSGFDPSDGTLTPGLDIAACHECHRDHRAEDFVLSPGLLDRFVRSQVPVYFPVLLEAYVASFETGDPEVCEALFADGATFLDLGNDFSARIAWFCQAVIDIEGQYTVVSQSSNGERTEFDMDYRAGGYFVETRGYLVARDGLIAELVIERRPPD